MSRRSRIATRSRALAAHGTESGGPIWRADIHQERTILGQARYPAFMKPGPSH